MNRQGRIWIATCLVAAVAVGLTGCDSAPGPDGPEGTPPVISGFSHSPDFVDLATLPPEQLTDTTIVVPFSVGVTATDADGDLASVVFVVQSLLSGEQPVLVGLLTGSGATYSGGGTLVVPAGTIANYSVLVYASDEEGLISNRARGLVRFTSSEAGGPPVVESVITDPEVIRPPITFRLIATVSDPDGLANILRVQGTAPNGSEFSLLDDGESFGDDVAGDGRFTARFDVPSASPGTQVFRIQAFDRGGLASEVFEKEVTIE